MFFESFLTIVKIMKLKLYTPQEVEVWYLIPSVKKEFVRALIESNLKQNEIAKILGLTDAAVSQYMHNKRAANMELPKEVALEIEISAKKLLSKETQFNQELQRIMRIIHEKQYICNPCRTHTGASNDCKMCYL